MNWEQKLQDAMMDEQATIEQRRIHGIPASASTRSAPTRSWTLIPLVGLCAFMVLAAVVLGVTVWGDGGAIDTTTVATEEGAAPTPIPETTDTVAATPVPTTPGATALPTVSEQPAATATPGATSLPTSAPAATSTPAASEPVVPQRDLCDADTAPHPVNVVNVELDDADGGLVLHSAAGVSTPEVGVLPPWGNAVATGVCEMVGSSTWVQLRTAKTPVDQSFEEAELSWANGFYLAVDPDLADLPDVQPILIDFGRDKHSNDDFAYTEPVVRWVSVSLASSEFLPVSLALLADGPTEMEKAAGFASRLAETPASVGCGGERVEYVFDNDGSDFVRVCVLSAGVGTDAMIDSQIRATLGHITSSDILILDGLGDCFSDMSGENLCLQPVVDDDETASEWVAMVDHDVWFTPETDSVNDHVRDMRVSFEDGCSVVTIEMGEGFSGDEPTSRESETVRGGIGIGGGRGEVVITFPDWFEIDSFARPQSLFWSDNGYEANALLVGGAPHFVRIANQSSAVGSVRTLSNPARIEIKLPCADGTFPEQALGDWVIDEFIPSSDGGTLRGYGMAFEAAATVSVIGPDGTSAKNAIIENLDPNLTDFHSRTGTGGLGFPTGSASVAWGDFNLRVSGLTPGEYRLMFSCDQCGESTSGAGFVLSVP